MFEGGTFDKNSQTPTNQNLTITFTPNPNMVEYTYNLYKDGEIIDTQTVNQNIPATFTLDTTGTYKISVSVTLNTGFTFTEESGEYIIDKEMPEITIEDETFTITNIKNLPEVTAKDNHDGDLSNK